MKFYGKPRYRISFSHVDRTNRSSKKLWKVEERRSYGWKVVHKDMEIWQAKRARRALEDALVERFKATDAAAASKQKEAVVTP